MDVQYALIDIILKEYLRSSDGRIMVWLNQSNCIEYKCEYRLSSNMMSCTYSGDEEVKVMDKG